MPYASLAGDNDDKSTWTACLGRLVDTLFCWQVDRDNVHAGLRLAGFKTSLL